jgi:protein-S-isoprenylcysteine O-methyltransferase Ste14
MNKRIKLILTALLVYGIPVLIWSTIPYTRNLWGSYSDSFIFNFVFNGVTRFWPVGIIFDFLLMYCFFILFFKKDFEIEKERVYLIYSGIKKTIRWIFVDKIKKELIITKEEKISVLFYLVKIYFTPVMLNFLIGNVNSLISSISTLSVLNKTKSILAIEKISNIYFSFILYIILTIDTFIFSVGYLFEAKGLKNVVKSVEVTAFGWLIAIVCYPPINGLTGNILGWYTSDFGDFGNTRINIIMGIISLLLFIIYLWASVALGFKSSNLTNRGIVSRGPYKYVRHPAYASRNLSWWIMGIPFIAKYGFIAVMSLTIWTIVYYLRALTEERHLMQDQDYVEYSKKVKNMFIPGIF